MERLHEIAFNIGGLIGELLGMLIKFLIGGVELMFAIAGFLIAYMLIAWLYKTYCYKYIELKKQYPEKYKSKQPIFYRLFHKFFLDKEDVIKINKELQN